MEKLIYVDNAATTAMSDKAINAMTHFFKEVYGNPSSLHTAGQVAKEALDGARAKIAKCLNCEPREIYFTSGGSEADNQCIRSAALQGAKKGKKHIISTAFEHHAVLHTLKKLEKEGFEVTYLDVHSNGLITAEEVKAAIRPDTALVTIMYANNEVGTIQPIAEIGKVCREAGVVFHTDAVQAVGHIPVDVKADNIDMLSISGHKFHGPKGIGALYCRRGLPLLTFIEGGAQERGKRAGTENLAGIAGMAGALEEACENLAENNKKLTSFRNQIIDELLKIPYSALNGDREHRLPGNVNISFEGAEGESLILYLDALGICVSSGSACTTASLEPSHVLMSLGLPHEVAHCSLRITLAETNTQEEVDFIIKNMPVVVEKVRQISSLWDDYVQGKRKHVL